MARGDHIFVERMAGLYSHHGIDCGDGMVIHFTGPDLLRGRVERDDLATFQQGGTLRVRAKEVRREASAPSLRSLIHFFVDSTGRRDLAGEVDSSPEAVIARAESRLGEGLYDPLLNNCEHFATWCRTGIATSQQTDLPRWPTMGLWPVGLSMM
ncbi:MAG: lecithin retinol acyltransferase family protein [bacterium]|nr:lecithin retinol acyltransferase family protein [bacterium]